MKLIEALKSPVKAYKKSITSSIIPKPYSHQVSMNIVVKKGNKSGTALVPCTIYAMDHSIDLNPALIRKKTGETLTFIKAKKGMTFVEDEKIATYKVKGKKIYYNPDNIVVKLSEEEKGKFHLEKVEVQEFERCHKCGQKLVLSEVTQTRYRSCPEIHVKLGDKAKDDTIIPVTFGVNKADIIVWPISAVFFILAIAWITVSFMWPNLIVGLLGTGSLPLINTPSWVVNAMKFVLMVFLWVFLVPRIIYKVVKLWQWYVAVKKSMKVSKYAYY